MYMPLRPCRLTGTHVVMMLIMMLVCLCVHAPQVLQAHWDACCDDADYDADYDADLSVCMYLGRPCRLTRAHVITMLMMVLVCLCVCT